MYTYETYIALSRCILYVLVVFITIFKTQSFADISCYLMVFVPQLQDHNIFLKVLFGNLK